MGYGSATGEVSVGNSWVTLSFDSMLYRRKVSIDWLMDADFIAGSVGSVVGG